MFENVFGYDHNSLPDNKQQASIEEQKQKGRLPMTSVSTPYVAVGYDDNTLIGSY